MAKYARLPQDAATSPGHLDAKLWRMGDHRASVKIEFTIHGKTYTMDSYINWFDDGTGIDSRVVDFFRESWKDAKERYDDECAVMYAKDHAADIERAERQELKRLQAKYSG